MWALTGQGVDSTDLCIFLYYEDLRRLFPLCVVFLLGVFQNISLGFFIRSAGYVKVVLEFC